MISQSAQVIAIVVAITALITSTILNILFRQEYYQMGVNFIYNYQTNYQTKAITVIQNLISILGNTIFIVAFLLLVHLVAYRKLNTIVYIMYIAVNAYFISIEKQAYQDSRPFFYNDQIEALEWTCPRSYGFPSGHSWVSVLLYEPVISDLIGTKGWKKLILITILLTGALIPISRQYLGSHTADQVTSGALHSISALILYRFLLQEQIYGLAISAMRGVSQKVILVATSILFAISILVPFIIYSQNLRSRIFDPKYIAAMNSRCSKNYDQADLQKEAGTAGSIIGLVFGLIYGLVISGTRKVKSKFTVINNNTSVSAYFKFMKGRWNYKGSCVNVIKLLVLYIIFGGVFVGVIGYGIPTAYPNFYFTYLMQTLGFCLFGISITSLIPFILITKLEGIEVDDRQQVEKGQARTNQMLQK